ncbi:MAG TPA: DNA polymerase III subunit [Woeseiaceae bacterium]
MELTWLEPVAASWLQRERQARLPHAVLLSGARGTGKRALAAWLARRRLGVGTPGPLPEHPFERPAHADLHWVQKPEDKTGILIDQIRDLVEELSLTSYHGGAKVAVIEPADAMNTNAANSLLKTLEEPPGDALIILIADRPGRLPATIFSRCQRLHFAVPSRETALAWLERLEAGVDWPAALDLAGSAPLAAVAALETLEASRRMAGELEALGMNRVSPVEIAERWGKLEPVFVLGWLARQVEQILKGRSDARARGPAANLPESVLQRMDTRDLFCYLDTLNWLKGEPAGTYNLQLTLESLLIDWAAGLTGYRNTFTRGSLVPLPGQGRY